MSYVGKKLWGSKNLYIGLFQKSHSIKKESYFFVLFLFLLQYNSNFFLVLKFQVYLERKTPSKNISEFLEHFSSRYYNKFFWTSLYKIFYLFVSGIFLNSLAFLKSRIKYQRANMFRIK